jgi:hypothetical protein
VRDVDVAAQDELALGLQAQQVRLEATSRKRNLACCRSSPEEPLGK